MSTEAVQMVAITDISADPANLRLHDERSIESIKGSLKRFGQQKPIVIDARGVVVAGNGTFLAAKALGWSHLLTIRSELSGVERVAYAIAETAIRPRAARRIRSCAPKTVRLRTTS